MKNLLSSSLRSAKVFTPASGITLCGVSAAVVFESGEEGITCTPCLLAVWRVAKADDAAPHARGL